jgi:hypothetical protein
MFIKKQSLQKIKNTNYTNHTNSNITHKKLNCGTDRTAGNNVEKIKR